MCLELIPLEHKDQLPSHGLALFSMEDRPLCQEDGPLRKKATLSQISRKLSLFTLLPGDRAYSL